MNGPRILVVHRRSAYTDLVSNNPSSRLAKLTEAGDPLVERFVIAHKSHDASMQKVKAVLEKKGLDATWCFRIGDLNPDDYDLVIAVGGDGTVLHASHSIAQTPVLAVNSSPSTSVGFFAGANAENFDTVLDNVLCGEIQPIVLSRMELRVNDQLITSRALNDVLFSHACPASTTRYVIGFNGKSEDQVSSGVWISTAAGSTAAIKSAGGKVMPPRSKRLQFLVREPFPVVGAEERKPPTLVQGYIADNETLVINSKTEAARLYVDGPHVVIPIDFGDTVFFSKSDTPLHLFGYY